MTGCSSGRTANRQRLRVQRLDVPIPVLVDEPSCPGDLAETVDRADLAGAVAAGDAVDLGRVRPAFASTHEIADGLVLDGAVKALHELHLVRAFLELLARPGRRHLEG